MIVGLTGGIGAGKSLVAQRLARRGAVVIDTDAIAREAVAPPSAVLDRLREEFGPQVVAADGRLDREKLAGIVFADDAKRKRLNEITHPEILKRVLARIGAHPKSAIVVVVVPLLFESGFERNCDFVVAVTAPEDVRVRRVMARDHSAEAAVRARISAQLPEAERTARASVVIANDGDEARLERETDAAWAAIQAAKR